MRFRFSIANLIAVVLLCGVLFAVATFIGDSEAVIAIAIILATVAALCTGVIGIVYRRRQKRAFWVGFTVFGGAIAIASVLLALVQTELYLLFLFVLPFGWIGGSIARAFHNSNEFAVTSPPKSAPLHPLDVVNH